MFSLTDIVCFSGFLFALAPQGTEHTLIYVLVAFPMLMLANAAMFNVFPALEADLVPRRNGDECLRFCFFFPASQELLDKSWRDSHTNESIPDFPSFF